MFLTHLFVINKTLELISSLFQFRSEPSPDKDVGVQLTMVSATLPTSVAEILQDLIDVRNFHFFKINLRFYVNVSYSYIFSSVRWFCKSRRQFIFRSIIWKQLPQKNYISSCLM